MSLFQNTTTRRHGVLSCAGVDSRSLPALASAAGRYGAAREEPTMADAYAYATADEAFADALEHFRRAVRELAAAYHCTAVAADMREHERRAFDLERLTVQLRLSPN
jgi:hypothetical protein